MGSTPGTNNLRLNTIFRCAPDLASELLLNAKHRVYDYVLSLACDAIFFIMALKSSVEFTRG